MNWPAYPHYRTLESSIQTSIPAHWDQSRIKYLGSIRYGIGEPPRYREEGTPLVRATNVSEGSIHEKGLVFVDPEDIPSQRILWLELGDIIVVRSGAYTGDSASVSARHVGSIAGFDMVLRIHSAVPMFVQYALLSGYLKEGQIDVARTRAAQPHLNAEELGECICIMPPLAEQESIVKFLGHETSKINALIEKQKKLISALREDRTATIANAVTKGLDPDAEMKGSDVQWLGAVPAHWQVDRIKNSIRSARNGIWGSEPDGGDDDIRCVRVADFDRPQLTIHDGNVTYRKVTQPDREGRLLEQGDLLLEKSGGGEKNPVGFVVLYDSSEPAICSNFVAKVRLAREQSAKFWTYVHHCLYQSRLTYPSIKQNTGIQNLDQQSYFNERVAFPPLDEQQAIVAYLDTRCAKIDALIANATKMIDTLREYRSSLISAAVTGQIDVRGVS